MIPHDNSGPPLDWKVVAELAAADRAKVQADAVGRARQKLPNMVSLWATAYLPTTATTTVSPPRPKAILDPTADSTLEAWIVAPGNQTIEEFAGVSKLEP